MALDISLQNPANNGDALTGQLHAVVTGIAFTTAPPVAFVLVNEADGSRISTAGMHDNMAPGTYNATVALTSGHFYTVVAVVIITDSSGNVTDLDSDTKIKCKAASSMPMRSA